MKDRAITPEQKKEVLDSILKVWLNNPDLRLGQLIRNSKDKYSSMKLFYIEDYELMKMIEAWGGSFNDKSKPDTNNSTT